jgi:septum site-determining protein MinD
VSDPSPARLFADTSELGGTLHVGEVVVVTSGKGGVGKTTAVANLGVGLATLGKKKVALVDTDIGLRNLDVVMGLENRIVYDLVDVVEGTCRLRQALIKDKRYEGLYLMPAAQTRDKNAVTPEQMRKLCADLRSEFDYVLIDCPAGIEQGFRNAVAGAQRAIVVTTPEVSAVRDADRIIGLMEADELDDIKLIVNRMRMHMVKRGDMMDLEDIREILSVPVIGVVPEDEVIVVSTNRGEPAILEGKARASQAYQNITRRLMGEEVPLMPLEARNGMVGALRRLIGLDKA